MIWTYTLWIGLALLVAYAFLNMMTVASLRELKKPHLFKPLKPQDVQDKEWELFYKHAKTWAEEKGFEWDSCLAFHGVLGDEPILLATWVHPKSHTYFVAYYHSAQQWHEFITLYGSDKSLSTSSTKDALSIPQPPGAYQEAFHKMALLPLFEQHQRSNTFLINRQKCIPAAAKKPTLQLMHEAVQKQLKYVHSFPNWYLEGAGWYVFRRTFLNNQPIERQWDYKDS